MSASLRTLALLSLSLLGFAACGAESPALRTKDTPPAVARPSAVDDPGPPTAAPSASAAPAKAPPSLLVEQVKGADAALARAIFAPIRSSLKECVGSSSGALVVQFERKHDATKMHIDPGASLDARARRCALEILSTVDTDGVIEHGAPADRPSNFSAQLRVEW
jgi:hypothetical protein